MREDRHAYERERFKTPTRKAALLGAAKRRRAKDPTKDRAWTAVNNAIRDGKLEKKPCEVCGEPKAQAHHDDYAKPLDVRWLCFVHHREHHGQKPSKSK